MYPVVLIVVFTLLGMLMGDITGDLRDQIRNEEKQIAVSEVDKISDAVEDEYLFRGEIFSDAAELTSEEGLFDEESDVDYALSDVFLNSNTGNEYRRAIVFAILDDKTMTKSEFLSEENNGCGGSGDFYTNPSWCPKGTQNTDLGDATKTHRAVWNIMSTEKDYDDKVQMAKDKADRVLGKIAQYFNKKAGEERDKKNKELPFGIDDVGEYSSSGDNTIDNLAAHLGCNTSYTCSMDEITFSRDELYSNGEPLRLIRKSDQGGHGVPQWEDAVVVVVADSGVPTDMSADVTRRVYRHLVFTQHRINP